MYLRYVTETVDCVSEKKKKNERIVYEIRNRGDTKYSYLFLNGVL